VKGLGLVIDSLEATAVNGGIEIELASPLDTSDSVELETVNGGVELGLLSESKATIAARAVNGGVRAAEELGVQSEAENSEFTGRRRLNGTMNGGGARVNISTTNGGVRIMRVGSTTS
jgi:DUF4097 and DUF4098 domain-containing protein YvlB